MIKRRMKMCNFKSAIVTRQGDVCEHWNTDSHEDLIDLFNLRDRKDFFVRVEFNPEKVQDLIDVEKYVLKVDEENVPEWFEEYREATQKRLSEIVSRVIRKDYAANILVEGAYILFGDTKIGKLFGARIVSLSGGTVNNIWGGTVNNISGGTVNNIWGGTVNNIGG